MIYELPRSIFNSFAGHLDHEVKFVAYGKNAKPPWHNLALECEDCGCVIADWSPTSRKKREKRSSPANRRTNG